MSTNPLQSRKDLQNHLDYRSSAAHRLPPPPSQLDRLHAICRQLNVFFDHQGRLWAQPTPDLYDDELPPPSVFPVFPLLSPRFRLWLHGYFGRRHGFEPCLRHLRAAVHAAHARALASSATRSYSVFHRFRADGTAAGATLLHPAAVVLDLADPDGHSLTITPDSIDLQPVPHGYYTRFPETAALPFPEFPHEARPVLLLLRQLLRPASGADFHRLLLWLFAALHPAGPYPVLVLHGDTAATATAAAFLRRLTGPSTHPHHQFPHSPAQLARLTEQNRVLFFSHLNRLSGRRASLLCDFALIYRLPVIVSLARKHDTPDPIDHHDLAPLCLTVRLEPLAAAEELLQPQLDALLPRLLGLLCQAVQCALRRGKPAPADAPPPTRLPHLVAWTLAAEPLLGLALPDLLAALEPPAAPPAGPAVPPQPDEKQTTSPPREIKSGPRSGRLEPSPLSDSPGPAPPSITRSRSPAPSRGSRHGLPRAPSPTLC